LPPASTLRIIQYGAIRGTLSAENTVPDPPKDFGFSFEREERTMTIELTTDEVEALKNLIEERTRELGPEIHHTDSRAYRQSLEALREKLERLQQRLAYAK